MRLKVAVTFETDAFTFSYNVATLLQTHIVTETFFFFFLHMLPVLANCRQSMWGKFRSHWLKSVCKLNKKCQFTVHVCLLCSNSPIYEISSYITEGRTFFPFFLKNVEWQFIFVYYAVNFGQKKAARVQSDGALLDKRKKEAENGKLV